MTAHKTHPITPPPTDPDHWGLRDCTREGCLGRLGFYCTRPNGAKREAHTVRLRMPGRAWKSQDTYVALQLARSGT